MAGGRAVGFAQPTTRVGTKVRPRHRGKRSTGGFGTVIFALLAIAGITAIFYPFGARWFTAES